MPQTNDPSSPRRRGSSCYASLHSCELDSRLRGNDGFPHSETGIQSGYLMLPVFGGRLRRGCQARRLGWPPPQPSPQWGGELNRCILHIDATSISSYPRTRAIRRKARSGAIGACQQGVGSAAASERNRKPGEITSVRLLLFL